MFTLNEIDRTRSRFEGRVSATPMIRPASLSRMTGREAGMSLAGAVDEAKPFLGEPKSSPPTE